MLESLVFTFDGRTRDTLYARSGAEGGDQIVLPFPISQTTPFLVVWRCLWPLGSALVSPDELDLRNYKKGKISSHLRVLVSTPLLLFNYPSLTIL